MILYFPVSSTGTLPTRTTACARGTFERLVNKKKPPSALRHTKYEHIHVVCVDKDSVVQTFTPGGHLNCNLHSASSAVLKQLQQQKKGLTLLTKFLTIQDSKREILNKANPIKKGKLPACPT